MARQKLDVIRKPCGFRINTELVQQLKIAAIKQNRAVNVCVEEAIEMWLKKRDVE